MNKEYEQAREGFLRALEIRPEEEYVTNKIADIDRKLEELRSAELDRTVRERAYNEKIVIADSAFAMEQYNLARSAYVEAQNIWAEKEYPRQRIKEIDEILETRSVQEQRAYGNAIAEGDSYFTQEKYEMAKSAYLRALEIRPDDEYASGRIRRVDELLSLKLQQAKDRERTEGQYAGLISDADAEFGNKNYETARRIYQEALAIFPDKAYPQEKIDEIDRLLGERTRLLEAQTREQAFQDSIQKAREAAYLKEIEAGNNAVDENNFDIGIAHYNEALKIWPEKQEQVAKLIAQATELKRLYNELRQKYADAIEKANEYFKNHDFENAALFYTQAADIMPDEPYPNEQLRQIDELLKERIQAYNDVIKSAKEFFDNRDYEKAYQKYSEALGIMANDEYATAQIKRAKAFLDEQKALASQREANEKAYAAIIKEADAAFDAREFINAKMKYETALTLKLNAPYPIAQLEKIYALLKEQEQAQRSADVKEREKAYLDAIRLADNQFEAKEYLNSIMNYRKALQIKPNETYPKDQIRIIEDLLAKNRKVRNNGPIKVGDDNIGGTGAILDRVVLSAAEEAYNEAINKADRAFAEKDYSVARYYYYKALGYKKDDKYADGQIEIIRQIVDATLTEKVRQQYIKYIDNGDKEFRARNFGVAKHYYYKALEIKDWEKYPKDQLEEIYRITHSHISETQRREYNSVIDKADAAYMHHDLGIARFYYKKALALRPGEKYPGMKLMDVDKVLKKEKENKKNIKYRQQLIRADEAYNAENYSIARFYYKKALEIKPDETYPKEQLKRIAEIIRSK